MCLSFVLRMQLCVWLAYQNGVKVRVSLERWQNIRGRKLYLLLIAVQTLCLMRGMGKVEIKYKRRQWNILRIQKSLGILTPCSSRLDYIHSPSKDNRPAMEKFSKGTIWREKRGWHVG